MQPHEFILVPKKNIKVSKERFCLDMNWFDAYKTLLAHNARMYNLQELTDFIKTLRDGALKNKPVFDGSGNRLESYELDYLHDEMLGKHSNWRGEWIGSLFEKNGSWSINSHFNTSLEPTQSHELTNSLLESRKPGINFEHWLYQNENGMPLRNSPHGEMIFYAPSHRKAPGFGVSEYGIGLGCFYNTIMSDMNFGARVVIDCN
jgi:hypothetical protein